MDKFIKLRMSIFDNITLVIVSYDSYKLIKKNLKQIQKFKTIIIENSNSNKIEPIVKDFNNIKYIKTDKNLGYGLGNNLGVKESKTPFVLILSPDIMVDPNSIQILYNKFLSYKNIGIAAPSLFDENGNRRSNGNISHIKRNKIFNKNLLNDEKAKGDTCYEFIVGCSFLIKKDFFEKIGGFDKDFFIYFEDNDLCDKVILNNKSIIEIPDSKMVHLQGLSSELTFFLKCKLSVIHKISEYIYYRKKTNILYLYKKIIINFFDYLQRFLINFIKLKFNKSFKNLLRILSIILYISKLYIFLY